MTNIALYQQLAECIGFGNSKRVPELFAMIADEEEARFLLAAAPPATIGEIAEKAGLSPEKAEQMVSPLFEKGLLFKSKKPGEPRYYRLRNFIQFHDGTVLTPGISKEYLDKWKEFEELEMPAYHQMMIDSDQKPFMRVIPVNVTVEPNQQVTVFDDVLRMLDEAQVIAVTNCSCRTIHQVTDVPLEVCIQLDKAAAYALERGTGRKLTRNAAVEMIKMCEDVGLVHTVMNHRGLGYIICNCDREACGNWPDKSHAKSFTAPSRFVAEVDAQTCIACETCLERCFFEAIAMAGENGTARVNDQRCMGCGLCQVTCPEGAIRMNAVRGQESIPSA